MRLSLNYQVLKKPKVTLVATAFVVLVYNGLFYLHPANQDWFTSSEFSWLNLLRYLVLEQYLSELLTTIVILVLIYFYSTRLKLNELSLQPVEIIRYYLKYLPLLALAFFVFNPFTQSFRYLLNEHQNLSSELYFNEYLLNWNLYVVYLIPSFLTGYGVLTYNLIHLYNRQLSMAGEDLEKFKSEVQYPQKIEAYDDWGDVPLDLKNVIWFEKKERKYFARTVKTELRTRETLAELEERLDPKQFLRVNRSVIVNAAYIQNYSYWENEKYILRLKDKDQTEFVMSRNRLKKIKEQLHLAQ